MNKQNTVARLDLPHIDREDKLNRILSAALDNQGDILSEKNAKNETPLNYWNQEYFNLHKVNIFQESTATEKRLILQLCNLEILKEAYFIEKAGVGYMAKMILLAETTEERMLYGLFAADEVNHFSKISGFLPVPKINNSPFLNLLEEVVESNDKKVLLFVLQVVLEGWGLTHYRSIAKHCQNIQLRSTLNSFLQDESRHHATGVTLFEKISLTKLSRETITEILAVFLQMVQVGPQSVVKAIEQVKGSLSREEKINIFEQLDTQNHSGIRLKKLHSLMHLPNATSVINSLENKGYFQPLKASLCVL
ncbi:ferritin-like domain-containing protein [Rivularia sp. PCC 7116]|uniref:ferritin-like domain-containing protein n=1 Tax=Rivularia sp. PCC 7116 TaxID=373994 RepID=UPI0002DAFCBA|nr:ferritin-like domain-containing protein [Rivularia sp. PCC 7116]